MKGPLAHQQRGVGARKRVPQGGGAKPTAGVSASPGAGPSPAAATPPSDGFRQPRAYDAPLTPPVAERTKGTQTDVRRRRRRCCGCCTRRTAIIFGFAALLYALLTRSGVSVWDATNGDRLGLGAPAGVTVEEASRPGLRMNRSDVLCHRPVIMIPGFVSTALELWEHLPCASSRISTDYRKRLFGASMLLTLLEDPACFFAHAALARDDASDPPGVRLRPDTGFSSVDYIVPGFWVWAKVFRNLADVGYGPENSYVASYDWRLSPRQLASRRVGYFHRLKKEVEHLNARAHAVASEAPIGGSSTRQVDDEGCGRAVFVTHSYGTNVLTSFLRWADEVDAGWTDANAHAFINIGGPLLGISKATSALLSGEFRDTAMLPRPTRLLVDTSVPRPLRVDAFRSWPCLWALSPAGGDTVWPRLVTFANGTSLGATRVHRDLLRTAAAASGHSLLEAATQRYDPFAVPVLPHAPRMHVVCVYGVSKEAETGYWYTSVDAGDGGETNASARWSLGIDADRESDHGVVLGDGDGTVPLASLGYLCRTGKWYGVRARVRRVTVQEHDEPNAAAERVAVTAAPVVDTHGDQSAASSGLADGSKEALLRLRHSIEQLAFPDPRGGVAAADHVDIMGNHVAIETILRVALHSVAATDAAVTDRIHSRIDDEVARLDLAMGDRVVAAPWEG